ncbi:MAG: AF1514 family protein [Gammaproteobacteria bacterium]|nr:AF1514 family protein [Gammaproteobacteria bacterium]
MNDDSKPLSGAPVRTVPDAPKGAQCPTPAPRNFSQLTVAELHPDPPVAEYRAAMALADAEAGTRLGSFMMLSWYDRDRDFESPQHVSECHQAGAVPGYVDYGLYHGATLKVDVENGRFVFFYLPVDL